MRRAVLLVLLLPACTSSSPEDPPAAGCDAITASLMNLDGVTIDNEGTSMVPLLEIACSETHATLTSNSLPHYDFVATTPNPLREVTTTIQIPLAPTAIDATGAVDLSTLDGCTRAYEQYMANPMQGTPQEPSGICAWMGDDAPVTDGTDTWQRIPCLNTAGIMIDGVPTFSPNEAQVPDPWGNVGFLYPDTAGDWTPQGAALDLCGGHTADRMHFHFAHEACFARDAEGRPSQSYDTATASFDLVAALEDTCTEESGIVGWSVDGYPIAGPCVCMARDASGTCTDLRRARSAYVYAGLGAWGDAPVGTEGTACTDDADCCTGADCDFACAPVLVDGSDAVAHRCVLLDYAWCTSAYVEREAAPAGVVYLDRCNGIEGADGYAYHATATFPYLQGCYRGEPAAQ